MKPDDIPWEFTSRLDGSDYGLEQLEIIETTAGNNSRALGNLVRLLIDKGLLELSDIEEILR